MGRWIDVIILGVELEDRSGIRGLGKVWGQILKQSLAETAREWGESILGDHFGGRNRSEYAHVPRTSFYLKVSKLRRGVGPGRFTDLVLTGASRRAARTSLRVTSTRHQATLRMSLPSYFTNPFVGTYQDGRKTKRITRQPDKVAELTRISRQDREQLRLFCEKRIRLHLHQQRQRLAAARFVARVNLGL